MKPILDISEHQLPERINYQLLAQGLDWVIIRVQYGSHYEDRQFRRHIEGFKQAGLEINVYAWVRGIDERDMEEEAESFFERAHKFQPSFWWLDIEERSMAAMVKGTERYRRRLKELGAAKVGAYIGNHLFQAFGYTDEAVSRFDSLWLPTYGQNTGYYQGANPTASNEYDVHQYTSRGRLPGYQGNLDLSRLTGRKTRAFYTGGQPPYQVGDRVRINQVFHSSESLISLKPLRDFGVITTILSGKRNPYLLDEGQLGWVNQQSIIGRQSEISRVYQVKQGESLSSIGATLGISWQALARINHLANPDLIYPGQYLNY